MADEVRLIDANALKESLKKLKVKGYNQRYVQGMQDAIDGYFPQIIDDAPTIEAEPDKGWISVKDKMPDEGKEVLIYCPEFLEEIRKGFYTEGDFYAEREDLIIRPAPNGYCTHWQPLPEPPKGEE